MSAQDVATRGMGRTNAPVLSTLAVWLHAEAHMPYIVSAWQALLSAHNLAHTYPLIPELLLNGFDVQAPQIIHSFTPPNHPL